MGRVARTAAGVAALLLAAALAVTGCSGTSSGTPAASATSPSASPTPADRTLAALAATAASTDFTGRYALDSTSPTKPDGTVLVFKKGAAYRIDVDVNGTSSRLITTGGGAVSCQVTRTKRACLLVAKAGKPLPRLFDPGLQRVFTTTLAAFAADDGTLTVAANGVLPASGDLPSASCFTVSGPGVDPGEYCLTETGLVRRAQFPSGTLTLQVASPAPLQAAFAPPVRPTPLP